MIESVPKEFNMDDRETTEDLYETPYEISMLRVSTKSPSVTRVIVTLVTGLQSYGGFLVGGKLWSKLGFVTDNLDSTTIYHYYLLH